MFSGNKLFGESEIIENVKAEKPDAWDKNPIIPSNTWDNNINKLWSWNTATITSISF